MYETLIEPDDPENASYEQKVLYWDVSANNGQPIGANDMLATLDSVAGRIPYIDLGYKPKEIGRLRVEAKVHAVGLGYFSSGDGNSIKSNYSSMSFGS